MIGHYISMALRGFRRHMGYTLIKIVALALGLTCFLGAHMVSDYYQGFDTQFANAERIAVVRQQVLWPGTDRAFPMMVVSAGPLAKYLRAEMPGLQAVARMINLQDIAVRAGNNKSYRGVRGADASILSVFDLPFIAGDARIALDNPGSAVLTAETARAIFGRTDVVGEPLTLANRVDATITGVISGIPSPSHLGRSVSTKALEILVSMDVADHLIRRAPDLPPVSEIEDWTSNPYTTYALLPADGSLTLEQLNTRLQGFGDRHIPKNEGGGNFDAISLSNYTLSNINTVMLGGGGLTLPGLLYLFGALILGVACLDFINLATAEAVPRAKEIGMRKTIGATRRQIAVQCLFEVGLLVLAALVVSLIALAGVINILNQPEDLGFRFPSLLSIRFWGVILGVLVGVSLVAGGYPAAILGRVRPIFALKAGGVPGSRATVRAVLVGMQFAVASMLLISAMVIFNQLQTVREAAMKRLDDAYVFISTPLNSAGIDIRTLQSELMKESAIRGVTAVERHPWVGYWSLQDLTRTPDPASKRFTVDRMAVSYDYFRTTGTSFLAGHGPLNEEVNPHLMSADATRGPNVVIDRAFATAFGWDDPAAAIGQDVYVQVPVRENGQLTGTRALPVTVIGVVETVPSRVNMSSTTSTLYYLNPEQALLPVVRIDKRQVRAGLEELDAVWDRLAPNVPMRRRFADEQLEQALSSYDALHHTILALTVFSLIISTLGLFGIARQVVSRRYREIGVRKSLGASTRQVVWLLLWDFSKPIIIANIVAWPLAFLLAQAFLSRFAERAALTPLPFALALLVTVWIAWVAVGGQVFKAARVRPSQVLRYE